MSLIGQRRILFALVLAVISCAGNETTGPSVPQALPVASVIIEAPGDLLVGTTLRLNVILRDVSNSRVWNRPLSFTSSDESVATIDGSGVVSALAEGYATITATSEGKSGQTTVKIIPVPRVECSPAMWRLCTAVETYVLVRVSDEPLPVHSPWGVGDWDYDSDAGTWQLTYWTLTLYTDGVFTSSVAHRAASGATIDWASTARYERAPDSVTFCPNTSAAWSAEISGNSLIFRWSDGTKFTFERLSK